MKKKNSKEIVIWILAAIPFLIALLFYQTLPDKIPMHWNIKGEVDSWGRPISVFAIPFMSIGISILFKVLPKIDPRHKNYARFGDAYYAIRLVYTLFMGVLFGITLYGAYHPSDIRINVIVPASVGILFAVIGNFMPKFKHNYFVGIKTPWTLANEEVWRKTHRLAGILWFWGGLFMTLFVFVVPESLLFPVFMSTVALVALVPVIYSYFVFRNMDRTMKKQ